MGGLRIIGKSLISPHKVGGVGATYPYRMSKWDIVGLTEGLGKIMASHNIIINGIAPGLYVLKCNKSIWNREGNVYCNPESDAKICISGRNS